MNPWTSHALVNVSIIAAIGIACYVTGTGWPLWALFFLMELRYPDKPKPNDDGSDSKPTSHS